MSDKKIISVLKKLIDLLEKNDLPLYVSLDENDLRPIEFVDCEFVDCDIEYVLMQPLNPEIGFGLSYEIIQGIKDKSINFHENCHHVKKCIVLKYERAEEC